MRVIIIGKNRAEYCTIKKRDVNKHFFQTRDQLYKIYPDALTPMEIVHDGEHVANESVIVFEENGVQPYHCKYPDDYRQDIVLASIDEHKLCQPKRKSWFKRFFVQGGGNGINFKSLVAAAPTLLVCVIVIWAMIQ